MCGHDLISSKLIIIVEFDNHAWSKRRRDHECSTNYIQQIQPNTYLTPIRRLQLYRCENGTNVDKRDNRSSTSSTID